MASIYTVKITDKLLRFNTTAGDWVVNLLPFAQTPNAPFEIHKTSFGDGNTVTIQTAAVNDSTNTDYLLPNGDNTITLTDDSPTATIRIPADGASPAYVTAGGSGGGGGGGGATIPSAPPVIICGIAGSPCTTPPDVLPRNDGVVEIDVFWLPAASATKSNFAGAAVYIEDPDISSGTQAPLDGTTQLNGLAQVSGQWAPVFQNNSTEAPAVVLIKKQAGDRKVRIYLEAFGPNSVPVLYRANGPTPTPSIVVDVPGQQTGESGQEYAFLVTNPVVNVLPDFNRPDPNYYLTFGYTPPDPSVPVPANLQPFSGCRIIFVPTDATDQNPQFSAQSDPGLFVPTVWAAGYKSPIYDPSHPAAAGAAQFRCYFCSEDTLGDINSLVEGVTPYALASIPQITPAPDVTHFLISNPTTVWLADGSFVNQATLSWVLPSSAQYAGVILYLVSVTGTVTPLSKFPLALTPQQANVDTGFVLQIPNGMGAVIPTNDETWTVAAISVSAQGALADVPANYGNPAATPAFHSPTVTWTVGPPQPGSAGSGQEYAPFVTISPSATITATETTSSDGVRMVSFQVGTWTDPASNQFGGAKVAMIVNRDPSTATYWDAGMATSFTTPAMPAPGTFGQPVPINFYIVSYDPQGHQNQLIQGTTPRIPIYGGAAYNYTPTQGAVVPARTGWFSNEFTWPVGGQFSALSFAAQKIYVGSQLIVGGAPSSFNGPNGQNGQIAALNAGGTLVAWIGQSEPNLGQGQGPAGVYGGWFGELYVGGTNPLDAPLFIDSQGIIQVGGIAAAQGSSRYPYISIRDQHGTEMGRIGAQISVNSGSPGDSTGSNPPQLTAGAWFTQLAVGGNSLTNWNVLITPSATNPLGSNFQMRNIALLSIDYPQNSAPPGYFNNEYRFDVGNSVWMAAGLANGTWVFPGIHIYEVDNNQNNFGATYISRGMVLRGTAAQNYQVLVSLVSYNGNSTGQDTTGDHFYGELTMYCPTANIITVDLSSGSTTSNNPYFRMFDLSGNPFFWVDIDHFAFRVNGVLQGMNGAPVEANAYNIYGYGAVINSAGQWVGQPIAAAGNSQSPWTGPINGNGQSLSNAGAISASSLSVSGAVNAASAAISGVVVAGSFAVASTPGSPVINASGAFVGQGVDVRPNNSVGAANVLVGTAAVLNGNSGWVLASGIVAGSSFALIGTPTQPVIDANGAFRGSGIAMPQNTPGVGGVGCGSVSCGASAGNIGQVACLMLTCYSTTINNGGVSTNSMYSSGGYSGGPFNGSGVSVTGSVNASGGFTGGAFTGAGVNCPGYGIGCGSLQLNGGPINGVSTISTNSDIQCGGAYYDAGILVISNGIFSGHGMQTNSACYAGSFGINGVAVGWNGSFQVTQGGQTRTCTVNGGIITNVA